MITIEQYAGTYINHRDFTADRRSNADHLLAKCAILEERMVADGVEFPDNPVTGSGVSGEKNGGFRPQDCPIGAPNSRHKEGKAVDRYDPRGKIDAWLMARPKINGWPDVLVELDMAIEHPDQTNHWSHWQDGAPKSGNRVFHP